MKFWKVSSISKLYFLPLYFLVVMFAGCATPQAPAKSQAEIDALKMLRFEDTPNGLLVTMKESVLFKFGSTEFSNAAAPVFDILTPEFKRARGTIIVTGHTDGVGSSSANLKLSLQRAEKVRGELIARQLSPDRISAKGKGFTEPLRSPERNDEDRQINRRATFLLPNETVESMNGKNIEEKVDGLSQVKAMVAETARRASEAFQSLKNAIVDKLDSK